MQKANLTCWASKGISPNEKLKRHASLSLNGSVSIGNVCQVHYQNLKTSTAQLMCGPRVRFFQIIPACRPTHRRGPSSLLWNTTCTRCNLVYTCSIVLTQKARISRAYPFYTDTKLFCSLPSNWSKAMQSFRIIITSTPLNIRCLGYETLILNIVF
jgi:hypothetical protein